MRSLQQDVDFVERVWLASAAKAFPPARATHTIDSNEQEVSEVFGVLVSWLVSFRGLLVCWWIGRLTEDYSSKANIFFQSSFMLITVQPSFFASL